MMISTNIKCICVSNYICFWLFVLGGLLSVYMCFKDSNYICFWLFLLDGLLLVTLLSFLLNFRLSCLFSLLSLSLWRRLTNFPILMMQMPMRISYLVDLRTLPHWSSPSWGWKKVFQDPTFCRVHWIQPEEKTTDNFIKHNIISKRF